MLSVDKRFLELVDEQPALDRPGQGATLTRWQALAAVAAEDLCLAKLYEGHTDAIAIMAELDFEPSAPGAAWGTWAAEPPQARLTCTGQGDQVRLSGRKAWCSGAGVVSHALVTVWDEQARPCLAAVAMDSPGVEVTGDGWAAVGMGRVASPEVLFDDVEASLVGAPGGYLQRPGFWHGGCGIAACWYGGCLPLAQALADTVRKRDDPHAAAQLGTIDLALRGMRAQLVEAAGWIDAHPGQDAGQLALRLRAAADQCATLVLERFGRAVGAGPLCRDLAIAQQFADLPVFIRQTHGDRDLAELGRQLAGQPDRGWSL